MELSTRYNPGRVAGGELSVLVNLPGVDGEVGELVESFDVMTRDLQTKRDELLRVERELAWKEMAKQVAHEIKNPLTPMKLAIQHLQHAYRDRKEGFEEVLEDVAATVTGQIETLSRIASEFSHFGRMPRRQSAPCDVNTLVGDAVSITVGAGVPPVTVTVADRLADPPGPVQVSVNVVVAASGPIVWLPETGLAPLHPPEPVQLVASLTVHVNVELP